MTLVETSAVLWTQTSLTNTVFLAAHQTWTMLQVITRYILFSHIFFLGFTSFHNFLSLGNMHDYLFNTMYISSIHSWPRLWSHSNVHFMAISHPFYLISPLKRDTGVYMFIFTTHFYGIIHCLLNSTDPFGVNHL